MTEVQIRADIKARLRRLLSDAKNARVVEEMDVCSGRARVDLAIISDLLIGIEIKGPQDDLVRLPGQVEQYSKCFDLVVLVVHESLADHATQIVPQWWGIVVGTDKKGGHLYRMRRRPIQNCEVNVEMVLSLLWREEIEALFPQFLEASAPTRASKQVLRRRLLAMAPELPLKAAGIDLLRKRRDWRLASVA